MPQSRILALFSMIALLPSMAFAFCGNRIGESYGPTERYLPAEVPDGCTFLYRRAFDANVSQNHVQYSAIRPRDFVCFGDRVHIDKPILTNGGDVLIFARELNITAQIDTRIYSNLLLFNAMQAGGGSIRGPKDIHPLVKHKGFCDLAVEQIKLNQSYRSYYITSPVSGLPFGANYLTPRMPDGLVPASPTSSISLDALLPNDGTDAPTASSDGQVLSEILKSGDIKIYAGMIFGGQTLPEERSHVDEFMSVCGDALPGIQAPALLHTQGLMGGRGGPGASSICIPGPPIGGKFSVNCFSQERYWFHTGVRGADSNGGMAGSIQVYSPSVGSEGQLLPTTGTISFNSSPGPRVFNPLTDGPGDHLAFRTPRPGDFIPPNLEHAATGSVCDFFPPRSDSTRAKSRTYLGPDLYQSADAQNPGYLRNFDSALLMSFFEDVVQLDETIDIDLEFFHDGQAFDGSASRASPAYLLFQDKIAAKIFEIVRWHEKSIIRMTDSVLSSEDNAPFNCILPDYLNDLDLDNARRFATSEYLIEALSALEIFQVDHGASWRSMYEDENGSVRIDVLCLANYLYKSGGVGRDLREEWELVERLTRIQSNQLAQESTIEDMRAFLSEIENEIDRRSFSVKTDSLAEQIRTTEAEITEILATITENSKASSNERYLSNLVTVATSARQFAQTLYSVYATGGVAFPTLSKLGSQAQDLDRSLDQIRIDSNASIENPSLYSEVFRLRRLVSSINRDILYLKSQRGLHRNRILAEKMHRANRALALRMHSDARLSAIGATAKPAVKAVILDFLLPITKSESRLRHNLKEIEKILGPEPTLTPPNFRLGGFQDLQCVSEQTPGCVSVAPSANRRFVYHEIVDGKSKFKVPMYIIPASGKTLFVQSFGLGLRTLELD